MFSSHERLRIALAQHQHTEGPLKHTKERSSSNLFSKSRGGQDIPRACSSRGIMRKGSPVEAFDLSQGDAQWFLNLPETIKRKHFTPEERLLLAGKCKSVIMDASDETLYRLGHHNTNRSCETLDSSTSTASRGSSEDLHSPTEMHENKLFDWRDSFRWLDDDDDLDLRLSLEEYHQSFMEDKPLPELPSPPRPRRRTLSLSSRPAKTPEHHRAPSFERLFSSRLSTSPRPTFAQLRNIGLVDSCNIHVPPSTACADSDAAYYQDPEARLKLRVYLASAQKFDEAVEFGFPSTPDVKDGRRSPQEKVVQSQTFLFDEGLFDDDDNKPETFTHVRNGKFDAKKHLRRFSLTTSFPRKPNVMVNHYPVELPGTREMTLRMTLTRPDLRDDEGSSHGKNDDPLALEPLPPPSHDSGISAYDMPPWCRDNADQGLVKKIWRKVKSPRTQKTIHIG